MGWGYGLWVGLVCTVAVGTQAQTPAPKGQPIEILNSDRLTETRGDTGFVVRRLIGNVRFRQDSTFMFCDSAYFYPRENQIEAISRVQIVTPNETGGRLRIYADNLLYDGRTRIAEFYDNVRLTDGRATLYTERLYYDRNRAQGYYPDGGRLVEDENELRSRIGYYYSPQRLATFSTEVIATTPGYVMETDSLVYETQIKKTHFVLPTTIRSDTEQTLYTEGGYYISTPRELLLYQNPWARDSSYYLHADTLYYRDTVDWGEAHCNVVLLSHDQTTTILGETAFFRRATQETWVTDNALLIQTSEDDTLNLWADTLYSINDTVRGIRELRAYRNARFAAHDLAGRADSLHYDRTDSLLTLLGDPVLWADRTQLSGDTILVRFRGTGPDTLWAHSNGLILSHVREEYYNQIQGKRVRGHFADRQLRWLEVVENTEVIYYPQNEDSSLVGLNLTRSGSMQMWLEQSQPRRVNFYVGITADVFPLHQVTRDQLFLSRFRWRADEKPYLYYVPITRAAESAPAVPEAGGGLP